MSKVPRLPRESKALRAYLLNPESPLNLAQATELMFWPEVFRHLEEAEKDLIQKGYLPGFQSLWSRVREAVGKALDESQHERRGQS